MVATATRRLAGESLPADATHRLAPEPPESLWYSLKCRALGPPEWVDAGTGIPLELADCPDRRLAHAAARLATSLAVAPGTHVTVVLPRRCYPPLSGRLLHDHTADRIARVVSRVPDATATIVPFDVTHRVETAQAKRSTLAAALRPGRFEDYEWPAAPPETDPIGSASAAWSPLR